MTNPTPHTWTIECIISRHLHTVLVTGPHTPGGAILKLLDHHLTIEQRNRMVALRIVSHQHPK